MSGQEIVAMVLVVAAAAYLVRSLFKGGGEGGCRACPKGDRR